MRRCPILAVRDRGRVLITSATRNRFHPQRRRVQMNHIVIGVDGSPAATAAARWAACEAAMRDVELTIVHVLRSAPDALPLTGWPAIPLPAEVGEDQLAQGEKILDDTLRLSPRPSVCGNPGSIASRVCIGAVVPTLSGFSQRESQMIVVGRRGRGRATSGSARLS